MLKPANCLFILMAVFAISCSQPYETEKQGKAYWRDRFIDSAFQLLYLDKDTARALPYYDALLREAEAENPFLEANRFDLIANYHYFFTADNTLTAGYIDSALLMLNTPELQNHYPRTYVGYLLFGGNIAYRLSQYSKANDYYFRAKKLADAHLNPCERTAFNYSIAMVLYRQQNFDHSQHYFEEAFRLQQTCAQQTTAVALQQQEIQSNIGLCYIQLNYHLQSRWIYG